MISHGGTKLPETTSSSSMVDFLLNWPIRSVTLTSIIATTSLVQNVLKGIYKLFACSIGWAKNNLNKKNSLQKKFVLN